MNNISNVFNSISENSGGDKHYKTVGIYFSKNANLTEEELTLNDNSFADITFEEFFANNTKRISVNAFGNASKTLRILNCFDCNLQFEPPEYDIWKMLSKLPQLTSISVVLNVSEIPSNFINRSMDGNGASDIRSLSFRFKQNVTIQSGAFQNLDKLILIHFDKANIIFKNESFKLNSVSEVNSDIPLKIAFYNCSLTGDSIESEAFDGVKRHLLIEFWESDINYLPEPVFKSVLDNQFNNQTSVINFMDPTAYSYYNYNSKIDCLECKNHWLIKQGKEKQVLNAYCKQNSNVTLFDDEIRNDLNSICN